MKTQSIKVFLAGLLATVSLLGSGMASAATVQTTGALGDIATGILNLDIGGTLYNVDFVDTTPNDLYGSETPRTYDFDTEAAASGAMDAIIGALISHSTEITSVGEVGNNEDRFYIGFADIVLSVNAVESEYNFGIDTWENIGTNVINPDLDWFYADVQVVPIPAAVWLFGSALGLLGWVRRRAT